MKFTSSQGTAWTQRRVRHAETGPGTHAGPTLGVVPEQAPPIEQIQRQQDRQVVLAQTQATADFLVATLAANGIHASHHAYAEPIPSVDWAQGYRVTVAAADVAEARAILDALSGRDGVALPPEDETG